MSSSSIRDVLGRRVWDSRGRPTVEAEVHLTGGAKGRAIAPAGASTGSGEALDRRDGGSRLGGLDVLGAVGAGVLWGTFYIPVTYVSQKSGVEISGSNDTVFTNNWVSNQEAGLVLVF